MTTTVKTCDEHPDLFGPYPDWEWGDDWPGDEMEERSDEDE